MAKAIHNFTIEGKPIEGRFLCVKLGMSNTHLYYIANKTGSDRAEDIAEHWKNNRRVQGNTMEWEGEIVRTAVVAAIFGIQRTTFNVRIRKYGPDCCLTYFTGPIPHSLLDGYKPKNKNKGIRKKNSLWDNIGSKPRTSRLTTMTQPGSWEKDLPCPPAGSCSAQEFLASFRATPNIQHAI